MTSQPGSPTFAIHIFINISRSKGNQAVKFGQLIFLLKSHTQNVREKLVPDRFLKNQN